MDNDFNDLDKDIETKEAIEKRKLLENNLSNIWGHST